MGEIAPAGGTVRLGPAIEVAYYRQDLAQLPADRTVYDVIAELRPRWERGQIQGHLGRFGFSGDEVLKHTDRLSGGEQARVALAMLVLSGANLLVLDEPTNHLDVESIEALEDALLGYDGSLLLVSHDRALLRTLATRVWELDGGSVRTLDGPFTDWEVYDEARRDERVAQASADEARRRESDRAQQQRQSTEMRERRDAVRRARRTAELAEADVVALDAHVTSLTSRLADPGIYGAPNGAREAARLGAELANARRALEDALQRWASCVDEADRLDPGG
jgi:ATP-binding cassette subfamily F protein 3